MSDENAVPEIDVDEAKRRVDGGALLLDVRNPDEWVAGRADGATWIPMGEIGARQDEIPTDRAIVVVCRTGARSSRVTAALVGAGYDATNIGGGMEAWAAAGYGVVADEGRPGSVL
jgi:rhodanese-related sulfurtransferase